MEIEVLRIGQRVVRDDRVTTHVALVARSFGAQKIYMNEVNPEIKHTISNINKTWGGDFEIEIISALGTIKSWTDFSSSFSILLIKSFSSFSIGQNSSYSNKKWPVFIKIQVGKN